MDTGTTEPDLFDCFDGDLAGEDVAEEAVVLNERVVGSLPPRPTNVGRSNNGESGRTAEAVYIRADACGPE